MNPRYWFYLAVITAYVAFGIIGGWEDIKYYWVWLLALISLAELGTRISIKKRK